MDDFLSLSEARRSVRSFYPNPVQFDDILYLIRCAMLAPSAGDIQPWEFIVITDKETQKKVVSYCPKQEFMYSAPVLLVVIENVERAESYYGSLAHEWCLSSCAAAVENLLLAAAEKGLGACWVTSFVQETVKEVLGIPADRNIVALVPVGYSGDTPDPKVLPAMEQIVFFNGYGNQITDFDMVIKNYGGRFSSYRKKAGDELSVSFFEKVRSLFSGFKK